MECPPFADFFLPTLVVVANNSPIGRNDVFDKVVSAMKLSEEEMKDFIPSGREPQYHNRISWALAYLKKAGFLSIPERSTYQITAEGAAYLKKSPKYLSLNELKQHGKFLTDSGDSEKGASKSDKADATAPADEAEMTPVEEIDKAISTIQESVCDDLLEKVYAQKPEFLENLGIEIVRALVGWKKEEDEVSEHTGGPGDQGIDGIVLEDHLGLNKVFIQAKRYDPAGAGVPREDIMTFVGSLDAAGAEKGVFITTATFKGTAAAIPAKVAPRIILIDGKKLVALMYKYNIGVFVTKKYEIKKIDLDYFEED